ncbi:MAG: HigA family addiction module antidote protein [Planctomycetes bacterium]|nr:HigA family addiction module antidote protein [Planctomycetota bacterium]
MAGKRRPTHPGQVLWADVIEPLGLTVTEAAERLGVARKTLSALINGRASLSPEMAVRIGRATCTSPESWLMMQTRLDLWQAQQKSLNVETLISC